MAIPIMAWYGMVRQDEVRRGAVVCGAVRYDMVQFGEV
jgi:hypothetical protein